MEHVSAVTGRIGSAFQRREFLNDVEREADAPQIVEFDVDHDVVVSQVRVRADAACMRGCMQGNE